MAGDILSPGADLDIYIPGVETPSTIGKGGTTFIWNGTTDAMQPVGSGIYYIKIEQQDSYGHTDIMTKQITDLNIQEYVELNIFNSSGEVVRSFRNYGAAIPDKFVLTVPDTLGIQKSGTHIPIQYGTDPALDVIYWDGCSSQGISVAPGTYEVQIIVKKNSQASYVAGSKTVVVVNEGMKYFGDVKIYPDPYVGTGSITFAWEPSGTGWITIHVRNVAGETVATLKAKLEDNKVVWNVSTPQGNPAAHGLYICDFTARNSQGYIAIKRLKLFIMNRSNNDNIQ
jgi:flagellar hook assembly protein FlgD